MLPIGRISRDEAVAIAREEAERRGWPWVEPVSVTRGVFSYQLMTNARVRGTNVNVVVSARDGRVVRAAFAPR